MSRPRSRPPEIPGYSFREYVSSGGFGDVHLYQHEVIGRNVAIKVLHLDGLSPASQDAFRAEASRMANLENRFVVTVFDFDIAADGRPYISMEYCPDHLGRRLGSAGLPVADALRYGTQVASAVEAAHRGGILHRDVKPSNVLLRTSGEPALTDFGISVARDESTETRGHSPLYAAPEVVSGASDGDELADVYSLGATVYALLSGRPPFHVPGGDNSTGSLTARTIEGRPPPTGRSDVPPSLERALARALARDPAMRFPSAMALARALQEVEIELGYQPTDAPFGVVPARPEPARDDADDEGTRFAAPRRVDPSGGVPSAVVPPVGAVVDDRTRAPYADLSVPQPDVADATYVPAGPAAPLDARAPDVPLAPDTTPRRWGAFVGSVAALGAVAAAFVVLAGGEGSAPEPARTEIAAVPAGDSLFEQPAVPGDVALVRADGSVRVTWQEDSLPDVSYVVSVTAGPQAGESVIAERPRAELDDPNPQAQVCVRVLAVRGSVSTEPSREECTR